MKEIVGQSNCIAFNSKPGLFSISRSTNMAITQLIITTGFFVSLIFAIQTLVPAPRKDPIV